MQIPIVVEAIDALEIRADVLVLKHAQAQYGADRAAVGRLERFHPDLPPRLPGPGGFLMVESHGVLGSTAVLFVGVQPLVSFGYMAIREFARDALGYLAVAAPRAEHVCLTLHGVGYGLDETEALASEVGGLVEAIAAGRFPPALGRLTVAERNRDRAERLKGALAGLLSRGAIERDTTGLISGLTRSESSRLEAAGPASEHKPLVFVAMPFDESMDDVYEFGIRGPVHEAGFLCERTDHAHYTGDILARIMRRIREASLVIADLTGANPNVYLEVGYAWASNTPTLLLIRDSTDDLEFDVRGHVCVAYRNISGLRRELQKQLADLVHRCMPPGEG